MDAVGNRTKIDDIAPAMSRVNLDQPLQNQLIEMVVNARFTNRNGKNSR